MALLGGTYLFCGRPARGDFLAERTSVVPSWEILRFLAAVACGAMIAVEERVRGGEDEGGGAEVVLRCCRRWLV